MDPITLNTLHQSTCIGTPNLFSLPLELRLQIYDLLLTPYSLPPAAPIPIPLPIGPLFIRAHYKTLFMSQHPQMNFQTNLLRVNRQIAAECLPILYSQTFWRSSCRLEQLASQIGHINFGHIKSMEVDPDDLSSLLASLRRDAEDREIARATATALLNQSHTDDAQTSTSTPTQPPISRRLRFTNLDRLHVSGYQTLSPTSRGTKKSRLEARALCFTAMSILSVHPTLSVLVQTELNINDGGADARDLSYGRVKWRFLRHRTEMREDEFVVDLVEVISLFESLIGMDGEGEVEGRSGNGERLGLTSWRDGDGVFRLYPYLRFE